MGEMSHLINLPTCELDRLGDIAELLTSVSFSRVDKEKVALALKNEDYIPKLLQLFQVCEKAKYTEGLHLLFYIVRGILYLDKAILFEVMFSDECILDVVGCLEYDPSSAQPRPHRESLTKIAQLQEVIPIGDPELRQKIRRASRARYTQDIIMADPLHFEEGFLSTLDSFISSSKTEILHGLLKDAKFLPEVLGQLTNEAIAGEQRCELMKIFKEFCAFSFTLSKERDQFLQTLAKLGILQTLKMLMGMDDLQIRSAAIDILSHLVNYSPDMVQEFVMKETQQTENDTQLITEVIEQIICSPNPEFGGDSRLMEILRSLIDPQTMLPIASNFEILEFLKTFYSHYIDLITAPLLADTSEEWYEIDNYEKAEILASVLELLSFCVERHRNHMRTYIINKDLLRRILVLMKSKHRFLALCALRFMRKIIGLKDYIYNCYIALGNLLEPVVNVVLDNRNRCNLLKSAAMELLEFIRVKDIHFLIEHIAENYSDALESLQHIPTFQGLKAKYEQQKYLQKEMLNSLLSVLSDETLVKETAVSQEDEELKCSEGEEKAAPMSPSSSSGSSPAQTSPARAVTPLKRHLSEVLDHPNEDDETLPKKRTHRDS